MHDNLSTIYNLNPWVQPDILISYNQDKSLYQLKEITCTNFLKGIVTEMTCYSVCVCVYMGVQGWPFPYLFLLHRPRRTILEQIQCRSGQRSVLKDSSDWNEMGREGDSRLLKDNIYLYLLLRTNTLTFLLGGSTWSHLCRSTHHPLTVSLSFILTASFFNTLMIIDGIRFDELVIQKTFPLPLYLSA